MLALVCSTHVHSHGYLQIALSAIIAVASALAVTTHHQVHAGTRLTAAKLRRDSAHRSGTRLTAAAFALGLGLAAATSGPDRVHRCQTCAGTRLNCSHVYAGTRAHCSHICPGTLLTAATSPLGLGSETQLTPDSFLFG